jgi:hypothetical protein
VLINKVNTIFPMIFFIIFFMLIDFFSFVLIMCDEFIRHLSAVVAYSDGFSSFAVSFIVP